MRITFSIIFCLFMVAGSSRAQTLAFPEAEGFGRFATGGRGGKVVQVTHLGDDGPGSLRAAVETAGPRIVVFRVSGNIELKSPLVISNSDITIAGQSAPGDGICIRDYPVIIDADNVILRFLRIRLGDRHRLEEDGLSCIFRKNIMIDHCSISWGIDEVLTVRDNQNATVQWCIVSESLNDSYHSKGEHGYGGIWGGLGASFHHNLIAHHTSRTPRFNGSRYNGKSDEELVDFRNNVIYNWGFNGAYGGEGGRYNVVANYYKPGPASKPKRRIVQPWDETARWFVSGNLVFGAPEVSQNNWLGVEGKDVSPVMSDSGHPVAPVTTQGAETAYELVLALAGAVLPKRDPVDTRIVNEVRAGAATYGDSIIDSQQQVGGWPESLTYDVPVDSDEDGMPDSWESSHGLDPNNGQDNSSDSDNDGYTNIEEYLNEIVESRTPPTPLTQ